MAEEFVSQYTGQQIEDVLDICYRDNLESLDKFMEYTSAVKGLIENFDSINLTSTSNNANINNNLLWKYNPVNTNTGNLDKSKTTMSGQIYKAIDCNYHEARDKALLSCYGTSQNGITNKYTPIYSCKASSGDISAGVISTEAGIHKFVWRYITDAEYKNVKDALDAATNDAAKNKIITQAKSEELASITTKGQVFGAVWNDFAEFRCSDEKEPGRVICEKGDGSLSRSVKRLQPGAAIISDTYGFAIGQTEQCQTPVAVAGRVLAYPYEDWWTFEPGEPVCAGPDGTVSKMTRREVRKYPERIIGTVSELPTYEHWGQDNVEVKGRIWIYIK